MSYFEDWEGGFPRLPKPRLGSKTHHRKGCGVESRRVRKWADVTCKACLLFQTGPGTRKPMQRLPLASNLFEAAVAGSKRITIRRGHRCFGHENEVRLGPTSLYDASNVDRTLKVEVHSVSLHTLETVPEELLREEGYGSLSKALEKMRVHYPGMQVTDPVTIVQWRIA